MVTTDTVGVVVADDSSPAASYIEWGPVFAGAVLASAISLVLFTFGGGVGLSITSPWPGDGASGDTLSILTMAWVIIAMIFSFIAGGYIAGRLRKPRANATDDEVDFRDGAHGLVVWATGMLIGAVIASHALGSARDLGVPSPVRTAEMSAADRLLRGEETTSIDERYALADVLGDAAADGSLSEEDRAYAAAVIARSTELSEAEATARIEDWEASSRAAADRARTIGAISAFLLAASALVAAAAAYFSAAMGGRHRDSNSPFPWTRARAHR